MRRFRKSNLSQPRPFAKWQKIFATRMVRTFNILKVRISLTRWRVKSQLAFNFLYKSASISYTVSKKQRQWSNMCSFSFKHRVIRFREALCPLKCRYMTEFFCLVTVHFVSSVQASGSAVQEIATRAAYKENSMSAAAVAVTVRGKEAEAERDA